jgi:isoleucyl-tRNA synthetase
MSKSKGNALEPMALLDRFGGDAVRWAFYVSDYTEPMRMGETTVRQASQRTLGTLLNVLAFYRGNALPPTASSEAPELPRPLLDRWLSSRLAETVSEVTRALDGYDHRTGALALQSFVNDLSTWYLRRSRPRFWLEEATDDRRAADRALKGTLRTLARLFAVYAPFTAEGIHQELTDRPFADGDSSVHAERWPEPGAVEPELLSAMAELREWVEMARELRQRTAVKSRIPLPELVLRVPASSRLPSLGAEGETLLREEINVERVRFEPTSSDVPYPESDWVLRLTKEGGSLFLSRRTTPELFREGLIRESLRRLQSARKEMGLGYTQHIEVELWAQGRLLEALRGAEGRLRSELLADTFTLHELPPPGGVDGKQWEFAGERLSARILPKPV